MSTTAVFNGFGQYETHNDGEKGITLRYAGLDFWFPFDKVTYLPDFTLREVDHAASTSDGEAESVLTYKTFRVSGERLAEEMLETQIPIKNSEKGLVLIAKDKRKLKESDVLVFAGVGDDGQPIYTEVQEITPTESEINLAHTAARIYKEQTIQEYLQSKRERMSGGKGRTFATGLTKIFMDELGVRDLDDVTKQAADAASLSALLNALRTPAVPQIQLPKQVAVEDLV